MAWTTLFDPDFERWLRELVQPVSDRIAASIGLLQVLGPNLGRPHVDGVKGSEFGNMKELRVQVAGRPWRILFAFDPERRAVLLLGGEKAGDARWYKVHVPIADARFRRHLDSLRA